MLIFFFRRGIEFGFHRLRVFVCNCNFSLGNLVIAYRTNHVVMVPKAFRTFHDQCPVHIKVHAMFSGTFRVKGGGRFRATIFWFLTVVFSVIVALLGAFSFNTILEATSSSWFSICEELPSLLLSLSEVFWHFGSLFPFLLNHLETFCSWLNLYRFLTLEVYLETYSALKAW